MTKGDCRDPDRMMQGGRFGRSLALTEPSLMLLLPPARSSSVGNAARDRGLRGGAPLSEMEKSGRRWRRKMRRYRIHLHGREAWRRRGRDPGLLPAPSSHFIVGVRRTGLRWRRGRRCPRLEDIRESRTAAVAKVNKVTIAIVIVVTRVTLTGGRKSVTTWTPDGGNGCGGEGGRYQRQHVRWDCVGDGSNGDG